VLAEAGPLSQNELGKHLRLTKSTVSRLVDQLARRDWVERRPSDRDGRQRLIELTTAGRNAAAQLAARRAQRMQRLLDRIPEADRATVLAALDALAAAADED
jgi:DNA-binding MarR family transcriptional regulator